MLVLLEAISAGAAAKRCCQKLTRSVVAKAFARGNVARNGQKALSAGLAERRFCGRTPHERSARRRTGGVRRIAPEAKYRRHDKCQFWFQTKGTDPFFWAYALGAKSGSVPSRRQFRLRRAKNLGKKRQFCEYHAAQFQLRWASSEVPLCENSKTPQDGDRYTLLKQGQNGVLPLHNCGKRL